MAFERGGGKYRQTSLTKLCGSIRIAIFQLGILMLMAGFKAKAASVTN
jgi:hypothetical protein